MTNEATSVAVVNNRPGDFSVGSAVAVGQNLAADVRDLSASKMAETTQGEWGGQNWTRLRHVDVTTVPDSWFDAVEKIDGLNARQD